MKYLNSITVTDRVEKDSKAGLLNDFSKDVEIENCLNNLTDEEDTETLCRIEKCHVHFQSFLPCNKLQNST